jgi:hypothetical protein
LSIEDQIYEEHKNEFEWHLNNLNQDIHPEEKKEFHRPNIRAVSNVFEYIPQNTQ